MQIGLSRGSSHSVSCNIHLLTTGRLLYFVSRYFRSLPLSCYVDQESTAARPGRLYLVLVFRDVTTDILFHCVAAASSSPRNSGQQVILSRMLNSEPYWMEQSGWLPKLVIFHEVHTPQSRKEVGQLLGYTMNRDSSPLLRNLWPCAQHRGGGGGGKGDKTISGSASGRYNLEWLCYESPSPKEPTPQQLLVW